MKIGELARLGDVNPKTIRYYESIGLLPEPARTPSGYRDYDETYADRLTFIRTAQRLGIAPCSYVRGVLDAQVDTIDRRIRELGDLRRQLTELVAEADRLPEAGGTCRLIEHVRHKPATAEQAGRSPVGQGRPGRPRGRRGTELA